MAEFPLFEAGGQPPATVRTSRIGPEPPMPEGLQAAGKAFEQVSSVLHEQHKAQQNLLVGSYHAGFDADIAKYQMQNEQNGYDKDWETSFQKAVGDSQKKWGAYLTEHGADASTIKHAQNLTTIASASKGVEIGGQMIRLQHNQNKALTQGTVDTLVQHSLVSGNVAGDIKNLNDTIDYAQTNHMLLPEEAMTMRKEAMGKMAITHRDYDIESNPAQAIKTFGAANAKNLENNPLYSNLTAEQRFDGVKRATELQKQNQAKGSLFLKEQKQNDLNAVDKMHETGQYDMGQLGEMFRRGSITQPQYYTLTQAAGHPTEGGPGDPGRAEEYRRSLHGMNENQILAAATVEANNQQYNKFDHAENAKAETAALHEAHTAESDFKSYVEVNAHNIPGDAMVTQLGIPRNSRQWKSQMGKVQVEFDQALRDYNQERSMLDPDNHGAIVQAQGRYMDAVNNIIKARIADKTLHPQGHPTTMPKSTLFDLSGATGGTGLPVMGEGTPSSDSENAKAKPAEPAGVKADENPAVDLSTPAPMSRRDIRKRLGVVGTMPSTPPAEGATAPGIPKAGGTVEGGKGGDQ